LKAARKASFLLQGKSLELLSSAVIRIPATKEQYERKLLGFLKRKTCQHIYLCSLPKTTVRL